MGPDHSLRSADVHHCCRRGFYRGCVRRGVCKDLVALAILADVEGRHPCRPKRLKETRLKISDALRFAEDFSLRADTRRSIFSDRNVTFAKARRLVILRP